MERNFMELEKLWSEWKVDKFIGEGSFGKVYKIAREDFGHTYVAALKVIEIPQNQSEYKTIKSEGLSDESAQEYFKSVVEDIVNEFVLMSKLKGNSNIVSYEDHSVIKKKKEFGWEIFIRMELLTPLFSYLEKHELTVKDVIQLGIDMCKALEVCQKYNIIHRDIKPENIFVSDIGTFKLGDFGIARQLEKTTSGMSKKGTYTYMAPEVYKGLDYNSTVDIYSLGIVLYRFLNNNRAPFMPPAPQQIRYSDKEQANVMRLSGQPMPKPCNAEGRLAEIVLKACAYDPKERYESPYAMRQELQTLLYTESEKKLAYPEGDVLTNDKNEYTVGEKTEFMKDTDVNEDLSKQTSADIEPKVNSEKLNFENDDNKTVMMATEYDPEDEKTVLMDDSLNNNKDDKNNDLQNNVIEKSQNQANNDSKKENKQHNKIKKDKNNSNHDDKHVKFKKKNRLIPVIVGVVILAAVVIGTVFALNSFNQPKKVKVPNLQNMKISDAEKTLKENGLITDKKYSKSQDVEKDYVISQEEKAGTEVEEGSTIHIVVCSVTMISVPDVTNQKADEARILLEGVGLTVNVKEVYSDTVELTRIISQEPKAGTEIEYGREITITVSKGEELIEIPDVTGLKKSDAKSKLNSLSMKVDIKETYSDNVAKGKVISQSVTVNEKVKKGTSITLKVSKGSKPEPETTVQKKSNTYTNTNNNTNTYTQPPKKSEPKNNKPKAKDNSDDSLSDWELIN